jgi:hypothetical protein
MTVVADQGNLLAIHKMIILSTFRYGEEAYGSASKAVLKKLEPTHNQRIRLALGVFVVCRNKNALCEAGVSTLAGMRNLNTTITAIRFINNPNHPTKLDEYALRLAASNFFYEQWNTSESYRSTPERLNARHSILEHHRRTSTITDSITRYAQSDEAQATKDSKLKLFAITKSTNITAKYTQTDRKKTKRSDTQ